MDCFAGWMSALLLQVWFLQCHSVLISVASLPNSGEADVIVPLKIGRLQEKNLFLSSWIADISSLKGIDHPKLYILYIYIDQERMEAKTRASRKLVESYFCCQTFSLFF